MICYKGHGDSTTACGKSNAEQTTADMGQATCPECYKALRDGYDRIHTLQLQPLMTRPSPVHSVELNWTLFDITTEN